MLHSVKAGDILERGGLSGSLPDSITEALGGAGWGCAAPALALGCPQGGSPPALTPGFFLSPSAPRHPVGAAAARGSAVPPPLAGAGQASQAGV